jgi:methyl-accepting chemotaxis protein
MKGITTALMAYRSQSIQLKITAWAGLSWLAVMTVVIVYATKGLYKLAGEQAAGSAGASVQTLVILGYLLSIAALALLWFIAGRLVQPIRAITDAAQDVAHGNLRPVEVNTGGEFGLLADVFNQMVIQLRDMLRSEQEQREYLEMMVQEYVEYANAIGSGDLTCRLQLTENVEGYDTCEDPLTTLGRKLNTMTANLQHMTAQVGNAAQRLNLTAADILAVSTHQAASASQQSSAVAQTSATADEVKVIAEQAALHAGQVTESAQRTVEVSRSGQQAVQETIDSMASIKTHVQGIAQHIMTLVEHTQKIGEIIAVVNEIASHSNTLALNAAVEAARAGEAGRGFAVVAAEVRNLARQSRRATADVRNILSEIRQAASLAVTATEEGTRGVDKGLRLAVHTQQAIDQLSEAIRQSAQMASQVKTGGHQQVAGVEQIAQAMHDINRVSSQSLDYTRQAERAAQNLNELASKLAEIVAQYQV